MRNVYQFVNEPREFEDLRESNVYKAMEAANNGDLSLLKNLYTDGYSFGAEHLQNGSYKLFGWYFDFKPFCKRYLVNLKYYGWTEYTTPNKTCLYRLIGRHNVIEIHEIKK